jgi:hypothetical protein
MKTLWDLIYEWRGVTAEAERIEAQAVRTRAQANALEGQLRDALRIHGPITNGTEVFLPPANDDAPVNVLPITEAIRIELPKPQTLEGGAA